MKNKEKRNVRKRRKIQERRRWYASYEAYPSTKKILPILKRRIGIRDYSHETIEKLACYAHVLQDYMRNTYKEVGHVHVFAEHPVKTRTAT